MPPRRESDLNQDARPGISRGEASPPRQKARDPQVPSSSQSEVAVCNARQKQLEQEESPRRQPPSTTQRLEATSRTSRFRRRRRPSLCNSFSASIDSTHPNQLVCAHLPQLATWGASTATKCRICDGKRHSGQLALLPRPDIIRLFQHREVSLLRQPTPHNVARHNRRPASRPSSNIFLPHVDHPDLPRTHRRGRRIITRPRHKKKLRDASWPPAEGLPAAAP